MIDAGSDKISLFKYTATKTDAMVEEILSSSEELCKALTRAVRGCRNIVMSEPEFIPQNLFAAFRENINVITNPTAIQLSSADAGITDAFAGIANTGSVGISVGPNLNTYVSLLPRKHIVVLNSDDIVQRPADIFNMHSPNIFANHSGWIFISGPSATADMGELVKGVHGPDKLHIILLRDK